MSMDAGKAEVLLRSLYVELVAKRSEEKCLDLCTTEIDPDTMTLVVYSPGDAPRDDTVDVLEAIASVLGWEVDTAIIDAGEFSESPATVTEITAGGKMMRIVHPWRSLGVFNRPPQV